jgi:hypothetical protein
VEELIGQPIDRLSLKRVDLVNDSTLVEARYRQLPVG